MHLYSRNLFYSCFLVISGTWSNLAPLWGPSAVFTPFHSELELCSLSDCICLYVLCCSSRTFISDNWKWSKIKSMVITTSSNLECNYTLDAVALSGRRLRSKSIKLCSEWNWIDWLIYVCQVKGKETDKKKPQSVRVGQAAGVGGGGASHRYMDEAWPPDGGRRVLNQTEINGVWETERKKFRHMPADLNPFFSQLINTGKCTCVRVCACVEGGTFCLCRSQ